MEKFIIELIDIFIRSLVSVIVLLLLTVLMGKRQLSQLTFFDYVIGISIGSIAAAFAIDRSIDYEHGITGLIIYALFGVLLSLLSLKYIKLKRIFSGVPIILIQNGKIIEKNLKKSKLNINDLLEECRIKGAFNISDIEFAIFETCGQISVLLKSQKAPLAPSDIKIPTSYKGLCANLIIDGAIIEKHLKLCNLDKKWLMDKLADKNIYDEKDVLLAFLDTSGNLIVDLKNNDPEPLDVLD